MRKFIVTFLLLCGCLIGYKLLPSDMFASNDIQPALAQSALLPAQSESVMQEPLFNTTKPTVAPLFRAPDKTAAPPLPTVAQSPTRTLRPTPVGTIKAAATPPILRPAYPEMVIYGDELHADWTIEQSVDTQINLWDTTHWFQRFDPRREQTSGATAIVISPQADYGAVFFTVRPESSASYERQAVLGISFWLNGGSNAIATDELAVTVLGSNEFPYWKAADHSVFPDKSGSFSETRLYFLKINRTIPANTWVNIVVWLDDLQYDPAYRYITGFYIKNDVGFRNTYYLDQVALLLAP